MKEWERREAELLRKENAWYEELHPFMRMIDNPLYFCVFLFGICALAFHVGVLIGMML